MRPVAGSANRRDSFTTDAALGLASGTLMTSIRQNDEFGSVAGALLQFRPAIAVVPVDDDDVPET